MLNQYTIFENILKRIGLKFDKEIKYSEIKKGYVGKERADYYITYEDEGVVLEIEGGTWNGGKGGHTSGVGYNNNCVKYNALACFGVPMFRFTATQIKTKPDIIANYINLYLTAEMTAEKLNLFGEKLKIKQKRKPKKSTKHVL